MQATFTVPLSDGDSVIVYSDPAGFGYSTPSAKYVASCKPIGTTSDIRPVYAPGEDGGGTQNFGLRTTGFEIDMIYVGGEEMECINTFLTDTKTLASAAFAMVLTGTTLSATYSGGCILQESKVTQRPRNTGVAATTGDTAGQNTYRMEAFFHIECVRP